MSITKTATQLDAEEEQRRINESTEQTNQEDEQNLEDQEGDLEQEEAVIQRKSPHEEMMDEMFKKRKSQYDELAGEPDQEDDEDEDDDDEDADDLDDDDADEMITLKVYGKNVLKTKAEVDEAGGVVAMQKLLAGELRLEEATRKVTEKQQQDNQRIIDENKGLKAENERLTALSQQQQTSPVTQKTEAEKKAEAKKLTEKMFNGDATELEDVMLKVVEASDRPAPVQTPAQAPIDTQAVARQVEADLEFKREKKEAVDLFEKDNADLNKGRLRSVVNEITKEVARDNEGWSPVEIMAESIRIARVDLDMPDPATLRPKNKLEGKKNKKRKVADVIPQANQRGDAPKPKNRVKTKREIFDEEINARRSHN